MKSRVYRIAVAAILFSGCKTAGYIGRSAKASILKQPALQSAHIGISIFDAGTKKFLYNYQDGKYFVPASNTKIFTLYAGLKYLDDSLVGMRYDETADSLFVYPSGDPTLLHRDFQRQPVIEKLQRVNKPVVIINNRWNEQPFGPGWSWDDYNEGYVPERSALPVYGNVINWVQVSQKNTQPELPDSMQTFVFAEPEVNWKVRFISDNESNSFRVTRRKDENYFEISQGREPAKEQSVPFITNGIESALELLKDTVGKEIAVLAGPDRGMLHPLHSQSADSLFRIMMYRSDNFFAEQILLMASLEKLGTMNAAVMIDTLLRTDLKGLPQRPSWVDGSGLSHYNLFTPRDFVYVLTRIKDEFGMEKVKTIFPGGGQGTLSGYYLQDSARIFAKTGTLTGQVALSGYLLTRSNRLLIFSVLVNNHQASASVVRRSIEQFISGIIRRY